MTRQKKDKKQGNGFDLKNTVLAQISRAYLEEYQPEGKTALTKAVADLPQKEQIDFQRVLGVWLRLEEDEIREIGHTLVDVLERLDLSKRKVKQRVGSNDYLQLVKKGFRTWAVAESKEKKVMLSNLLVNAAILQITPDFVITSFIDWINRYSDEHLAIVREIFLHPGITRKKIWIHLHGELMPEDSAAADLYKLIILDLTTGHLIRQERVKDYKGRFLKPKPSRVELSGTQPMISAFDDEKGYELTELGKQFIRYTM